MTRSIWPCRSKSWQYGQVRPLLAAQADSLVWLDLSRVRVMRQVIRRTVRRRRRGGMLWNGNVEPPLWTFFTDADHIVRWAWRTHQQTPGGWVVPGWAAAARRVRRFLSPSG